MYRCNLLLTLSLGLLLSSPATVQAYDGWGSELSHAAGGMALAGAITAIADHYQMENRAMVGFGVSSALSILAEGYQLATDKDAKTSSSLLDIGAHIAGSAIGAMITDRYWLSPVVHKDLAGGHYVGIAAEIRY